MKVAAMKEKMHLSEEDIDHGQTQCIHAFKNHRHTDRLVMTGHGRKTHRLMYRPQNRAHSGVDRFSRKPASAAMAGE